MSKIQEKIKELQRKQLKIEYISYIADLIKNDTKCIDFKDVQKEIVEKIEPFLLDMMTAIENGTEVTQNVTVSDFDQNQIAALKQLADRVLTKPPAPQAPQNNGAFNNDTPPPPAKPRNELSNSDKMNFAMNNRHLANKRVQVINDKGVQIFGNVVGLDAPHVLVKTETGPTIEVPLEKVVPV